MTDPQSPLNPSSAAGPGPRDRPPRRLSARLSLGLKVPLTMALAAASLGAGIVALDGTTEVADASAPVRDERVSGLTGVARSTYDRDVAWTVGGAGNGPNLLGVDPDGDTTGFLRVNGADNHDWQDISPGPWHTLWILESERNQDGNIMVHRVWEPANLSRTTVPARSFELTLPRGSGDVGSLLVHPESGQVLLTTNGTESGGLFRAPRRLDGASPNEVTRIGSVPPGATGGAFAPSGTPMVVVDDDTAYLYEAPGRTPRVMPLATGTRATGVSVDRSGRTLLLSTARPVDAILTEAVDLGGPMSPDPTTPPSAIPTTGSPTAPPSPSPTTTRTPSPTPTSPTPTGPGENPSRGPLQAGLYNGSFSYEDYRRFFGSYPDVETIYLNADQVDAPNLRQHQAQIDRGISPIITLGHRNGPFTRAQIAAWGPEVQAYFSTFVAGLRDLSEYAADADNGARVYFADEHEAQVKINQDKYTYPGYGATGKPTTAQSAAAWNRVMGYVRTAAPDVLRTYWYGGSGANEDTFVSLLEPSLIQVASFDPYRWRHNSPSDTPQELWGSKVAGLKAQPWMRNANGSLKPWGLTEWGTDASLGDLANSVFIGRALSFLRTEGASFAVYFNRVDNNDNANDFVITDGSQPLTLAAMVAAVLDGLLGSP